MSHCNMILFYPSAPLRTSQLDLKLSILSTDHSVLCEEQASIQRGQILQASRLQEAYDTSARFELELADQSNSLEGLRAQLKDAEKEGRDAQKRYLEQVRLPSFTRAFLSYSLPVNSMMRNCVTNVSV